VPVKLANNYRNDFGVRNCNKYSIYFCHDFNDKHSNNYCHIYCDL
jgi:hypothetical protein